MNNHGVPDRFNGYQAHSKSKDLASVYLNTFPPSDNSASHRESNLAARSLLKGSSISNPALEDRHAILAYRLGLINLAFAYKDLMGLEFCDCENLEYLCRPWQKVSHKSER